MDLLSITPPFGGRWLLRADGVVNPDRVARSLGVDALGLLLCVAFVCACGSLVARRDPVAGVQSTRAVTSPRDALRRGVGAVERVVVPSVLTGAWALTLTAGVLVVAPTFAALPTLLVALAIATSVRASAHYSERLSETVARILPVALLGVVVLDARTGGPAVGAPGSLLGHWRAVVLGLALLLAVEASLRTVRVTVRRVGRRPAA